MKIIKTRNRTEIKISHLELRQLQDSGDLQLRQCASEILKVLQETNNPKINIGIDLAEKGEKDNKVKSYMACSVGFKHNPIHYLFKSDKEIRKKEERRKAWKEVDKEIFKLHGEFEKEGVPLVVLAMLVAFQQIIYNKLIREEQKYD